MEILRDECTDNLGTLNFKPKKEIKPATVRVGADIEILIV